MSKETEDVKKLLDMLSSGSLGYQKITVFSFNEGEEGSIPNGWEFAAYIRSESWPSEDGSSSITHYVLIKKVEINMDAITSSILGM